MSKIEYLKKLDNILEEEYQIYNEFRNDSSWECIKKTKELIRKVFCIKDELWDMAIEAEYIPRNLNCFY